MQFTSKIELSKIHVFSFFGLGFIGDVDVDILKLMLLLVVVSILKVLTIQTFDLRSVFETMN